MCEGVDFCPSTGTAIDKAPCRVSLDFGVPIKEVLEGAWGELLKIVELQDAARRGKTGYQMIGGER